LKKLGSSPQRHREHRDFKLDLKKIKGKVENLARSHPKHKQFAGKP
jgi:hypothetical protein